MTIGRTRSTARTLRPFRDRTDAGGGGTSGGTAVDEMEFDDTDDDADDDADDGTDNAAEPEPFVKEDGKPFTKADYEALQLVVRNARKEARDAKRTKTGPAPKTDDDAPADAERIRIEAEAAVVSTWKPLVVRGQASAALTAAGLIGKPDRLLKLLDMGEIDVDPATGELDGLDEQVADLKRDYPHLFRRKGSRAIDAADRQDNGRQKLTGSALQAAQLRGEM